MSERDLVTLSRYETHWRELPSSERVSLRAVELAFVALQQSKLFQRAMVGRGITPDEFLSGVTTLEVLTAKVDGLFASLTDKGREKLGRTVLSMIGHRPNPSDLNGDLFAVKESLVNWVRRDFGVENSLSRE